LINVAFMAVTTQAQAEASKAAQKVDIAYVARATNLSRRTIYRIEQDRAEAEAAMVTWGQ
jgi:hypothetical protein